MSFREHTRRIQRRIIITGTLRLTSPTLVSNGDSDSPLDIALLRDSVENKALLPGTGIAGALRHYVRSHYGDAQAGALFGSEKCAETGTQSALLISDALSSTELQADSIELRDGVCIDQNTRTAAEQQKYDLEALAANTTFDLEFELLVPAPLEGQPDPDTDLVSACAAALHGLQQGAITLGMKKRRGFGRCSAGNWRVWDFNMADPQQALAWLRWTRNSATDAGAPEAQDTIIQALGDYQTLETHPHRCLALRAIFTFADDALLIRAGQNSTGIAPDVVHLQSHTHDGKLKSIIPGTSWVGVLRHRAERIVRTLSNTNPCAADNNNGSRFIHGLFGMVDKQNRTAIASRVLVADSSIDNVREPLVQSRIAIDRFTGGALHGALFNEQPVWKTAETRVELVLEVENATDADAGLMLLLLKDLWTADLPIGGTSSIGRGRLQGIGAELNHAGNHWILKQSDQGLTIKGSRCKLQALVNQFIQIKPEVEDAY